MLQALTGIVGGLGSSLGGLGGGGGGSTATQGDFYFGGGTSAKTAQARVWVLGGLAALALVLAAVVLLNWRKK